MFQNWRITRILKSEWGLIQKRADHLVTNRYVSCDCWRWRWIASYRSVVCSHSHKCSRRDWMEGLSADLKLNRAPVPQTSAALLPAEMLWQTLCRRKCWSSLTAHDFHSKADFPWAANAPEDGATLFSSLSDFGLFTAVTSGSFDFRCDLMKNSSTRSRCFVEATCVIEVKGLMFQNSPLSSSWSFKDFSPCFSHMAGHKSSFSWDEQSCLNWMNTSAIWGWLSSKA